MMMMIRLATYRRPQLLMKKKFVNFWLLNLLKRDYSEHPTDLSVSDISDTLYKHTGMITKEKEIRAKL